MDNKITITTSGNVYDIIPKEVTIINNDRIIAQASNAIINFLKSLNIGKIIYVDDKCSINELFDDFMGKTINLKNSKPNIDFLNHLWNLPELVFKTKISELWESKNEEERRQLYVGLLTFDEDSEDLENSLAPLSLKKHLKTKIELFSPNEWVQKKNDTFNNIGEESKLLILFDIDFGKSPLQDGRNGLDLAREVMLDDTVNNYVYCGIFSHLFNVNQEYEKRNEFCGSHGFKKTLFYTISKKRFLNDTHLPALAEGIRNALLIDKIEDLKQKSFEILKKSFNDSLAEINSMSPESFNHAIQKSSKQEGVWEVDTLYRLSNIITKNRALNAFSSKKTREKVYNTISKIREIESIATGSETPIDKASIKELRDKELFSHGSIINTIHYPISNGDIFKIKDKEYILLTQPCNLALRKDGLRARNYNTGFLVELINVTKDYYLNMSFAQRAICERIEDKNGIDENVKLAQFSTFKIIDLHILDLCVFNDDGVCRIKISEKEPKSLIISESWVKRYKKIHKSFESFSNNIQIYKKLKSNSKLELIDLIFKHGTFKDFDLENDNCFNNRSKVLQFNIHRLRNYKSPYSDDLLQKFMQYLSRNAFNHDFTNG